MKACIQHTAPTCAAGLGEGYSGHSGRVGLEIRMTRRGSPRQAVQTHGRWKSPQMPARYIKGEKTKVSLGSFCGSQDTMDRWLCLVAVSWYQSQRRDYGAPAR